MAPKDLCYNTVEIICDDVLVNTLTHGPWFTASYASFCHPELLYQPQQHGMCGVRHHLGDGPHALSVLAFCPHVA